MINNHNIAALSPRTIVTRALEEISQTAMMRIIAIEIKPTQTKMKRKVKIVRL